MGSIIDNQFPFKIYEAKNLASTEAYVYLGKASIAGLNGADENYFSHQADNNCFSTFLFASVIGGRNIRIDPATEADPFVYIDSRWYDFRPCGVETNDETKWPANSILSNVEYGTNGDVVVNFKGITTDGSIVIEGGNSSFVWSDQGPQGNLFNDASDANCNIQLSTHKYVAANICDTNGLLAKTQGVPGASDVIFYFKSLIGGSCIRVDDDGQNLIISFDVLNCNPCLLCNGDIPGGAITVPSCSTWVPPSVGTLLTI